MTSHIGAFPHLGYADYAALRAGVMSGEVTQIAIRLSQLDTGDSDDDASSVHNPQHAWDSSTGRQAVTVRSRRGTLALIPVKCDVAFSASAVTVKFDTAIAGYTASVRKHRSV